MSSPLLPRASKQPRSNFYYGSTEYEQHDQISSVSGYSQDTRVASPSIIDLEKSPAPPSLCGRLRGSAWGLAYVYQAFWVSAICSLTAPFYPTLATTRGDNTWVLGAAMSTFNVSMLPGSFLAEILIARKSLKVTYLIGVTGISIYGLLCGTLYWIDVEISFVGVTILSAAFGGTMMAIYVVSVSTVMTSATNGGLWMGIKETVGGVGILVGQAAGGAIIDHWKYPTPYFAFVVPLSLMTPFISGPSSQPLVQENDSPGTIDEPGGRRDDESTSQDAAPSSDRCQPLKNCYRLLLDPLFVVNIVNMTMAASLGAYNDTTLEPHLAQFNLSNTEVGVVFTIKSCGSSFGAILAGILTVYKMEKCYILTGQVLSVTALLLMGPAPFLPFKPSLTIIYVGQLLLGFGSPAQTISSITHALRYATDQAGYPNDVRITSFISSCLCRCLLVGGTATPPLAGLLVSSYGYRTGSMFMLGALSFATLFTAGSWLTAVFRVPKEKIQYDNRERQPLLRDSTQSAIDSQHSPIPTVRSETTGSTDFPYA
ncbi:unnamed protein product [Ixodes hexagonus]